MALEVGFQSLHSVWFQLDDILEGKAVEEKDRLGCRGGWGGAPGNSRQLGNILPCSENWLQGIKV